MFIYAFLRTVLFKLLEQKKKFKQNIFLQIFFLYVFLIKQIMKLRGSSTTVEDQDWQRKLTWPVQN